RRIANYNLTRQSPATISSIAFTLASEQGIFEPEAAIGKLQVKIREELAEIDYRKNLQEQGIIPPVGEIASYSLSDLGLEQPTDHTQAKQTLIEVVNKLRRRGMTPVLTAGSISDDFFIVAERVR
ncbi:MAG TPA: hypothetical protein VK338_01645, partial [Candidatus Nitrosocosmicus sp.]|nr:hypothetical protein [Candidatus Nitrosocosmicus sp.]